MKNAYFSKYTLYKNTKVDSFGRKVYNDINIPFDDTDIYITIDDKYENKPGMIAQDYLGSARFSWVVSYFNRDLLEDSLTDLYKGLVIRLPLRERLLKYF